MENTALIALSHQAALRRQMDVVANNFANVNTTGYKGERMMFVYDRRKVHFQNVAGEIVLPPKMLIVHQFTPSMITNKSSIRGTAHVHVLLQMDGFGSLILKRGSWERMVAELPPGAKTGWKNFFVEDRPTPTPGQTMANTPTPSYVSYQ